MLQMLSSLKIESYPTHHIQYVLDRVNLMTGALRLNVPQIVEMEKLRSLPPNTFGSAWADFLDERQLQPLATGKRRQQLHDGIHVLTGYDTDPIGKAQLQAFLLGAQLKPLNLIGLIGLLGSLSQEQSPCSVWNRLWQAYQRGRYSLFDPDDWQPELLWYLPLDQVQALFRV